MATATAVESLQVLFGKAFLLELERGNLEVATVFARAFLLRKTSLTKHPSITFARGTRASSRSSKRPHR